MKHLITSGLFLALVVIFTKPAIAADELIFDSTNNYLGACQLTDKSAWELTSDINVTTFEVWYNWAASEKDLPVTVNLDGREFAKFTATRASCDPYQSQWCNADFPINKLFPKGKYTTQIASARQCLKPGGTGAIRLYSAGKSTVSPSSTPNSTPTTAPNITPTDIPVNTLDTYVTEEKCSSCTVSIVITAVASIIASSGATLLIMKFTRKSRS